MFTTANGEVTAIITDEPDFQEIMVRVDGESGQAKAYNYPRLHHRLAVGERVLFNTAAVELGLGTGGRHLVIPDHSHDHQPLGPGHIMKLRYTPWQFPILAVEEAESPYHAELAEEKTLDGAPVVLSLLHSMLPGIILGYLSQLSGRTPRIAYIMTDAAALPLPLSNLVRELKTKGLLDITITTGHAFGGDMEAVGVPSALLAAKHAAGADLIILGMGPGIVGTDTRYGFSGVEQSWFIDLVRALDGIPVAVPRISGADPRPRHYGLSHHTATVLKLASGPAYLGISGRLPSDLKLLISRQISADNLHTKHHWLQVEDPEVTTLFAARDMKVTSMGRGVTDDPAFFQSAVAAGVVAAFAQRRELRKLSEWRP